MSTVPMTAERQSGVRTCEKCGQTAVVQVFEWKHTVWGASTGQTTRELRCQSCGARYTIHPKARVIGLWVLGGMMTLATCVGGLPFFWVAWRRSQIEQRIPLVPGAPLPPLRFRGGPPLRTCAGCGSPTSAVRITRHTHNGIPTGTEYEYRCAKCGREFAIDSPLQQVFSLLGTLLLLGIAAAFLTQAESPGWRWGGSIVSALIALLLVAQAGRRLVNRFRYPVVEEA